MSIKTDIYRSALRDYDSIKSASEAKRREMKDKIYAANPRLAEIDRLINTAGAEAARKIIKSPADKDKINFELKERLYELKTEKSMIYSGLGITGDYFDSAYRCPKCRDTGMVDGKECSCFRQYLIKKSYGRALLSGISDDERFDTFNLGYYSRTERDRHGVTYYENMESVLRTCKRFAERFGDEYDNLLLMGKTGLGKTFLCNAVAREVLDKGFTVIYISADRLFKTLQDEQFNRTEDEEYGTFYDDVLSVDLLIIDDLGTEFATSLVPPRLFNIVNDRMVNERPMIVSTNLMPDNIKEQYSDRVLSRMTEGYTFLTLTGEDVRIKKQYII